MAPAKSRTDIRLVRFKMKDLDEVRRLWEECGLTVNPSDERAQIATKLTRDPDLFLLAKQGPSIVGSVIGAWDGRRGWIYHLAVRKGARRGHVGTALVKRVEDLMRQRGVQKVNAIVFRSNAPSLGLFRGLGFKVQRKDVVVGKWLTD